MAFENVDPSVFDLWFRNFRLPPTTGQRVVVLGKAWSGCSDNDEAEEEVEATTQLVTMDSVHEVLRTAKDPLSATGVARLMNCSNHSTSQAIRKLAKKGRAVCVRQTSKEKFWMAL